MKRVPISRPGWIGVLALLLAGLLVLFTASVLMAGPESGKQELTRILQSPGTSSLMGTDQLGRDQASRVALALRNTFLTVLVVVAISGVGGGLLGLLSGYIGGRFDLVLQRLIDALMALPLLVLALAVVAAAGPTFWSVTLSISVAFAPLTVRVARSSAVSLRGTDYVAVARISGARTDRIVLRHLVPNALGPWSIVVGSQAGAAVLVESALAFLGVAPGRITLGGLLGGEVQAYMYGAPWLIIWPGVALILLTLCVNLVAEWIAQRTAGQTRTA